MTSAYALIKKAALLLDMRGDLSRAIEVLKEAINISSCTPEDSSGIEARVFLIDLIETYKIEGVDKQALVKEAMELAENYPGDKDVIIPFLARLDEIERGV